MRRILCPRASGVLCALGLAAAAPRRDAARTVMLAGESLCAERLRASAAALLDARRAALGRAAGADRGQLRAALPRPVLRARGRGGGASRPSPDALRESFARAHERRYGYRDDRRPRSSWSRSGLRVALPGVARRRPATAPASLRQPRSHPRPRPGEPARAPRRAAAPRTVSGRAGRSRARRGVPARRAAAGYARARARDLRAGGVDAAGAPPGWEGEVDELGTVRLRDAGGARGDRRDRAAGRRSARCARPVRRWARC